MGSTLLIMLLSKREQTFCVREESNLVGKLGFIIGCCVSNPANVTVCLWAALKHGSGA